MKIKKLSVGQHLDGPESGACVMELVSYLANEPWSDHPECADPAITAWCIWINDEGDQKYLDILQELAPRIVGTRDQSKAAKRARLFSDFAQVMAQSGGYAAEYADEAAEAAEHAAKSTKYAEHAAKYAQYAGESSKYTDSEIFDLAIEMLRKCLDV